MKTLQLKMALNRRKSICCDVIAIYWQDLLKILVGFKKIIGMK